MLIAPQNPSSFLRPQESAPLPSNFTSGREATTPTSEPFTTPVQSSILAPKTLKLSPPQETGINIRSSSQTHTSPEPALDTDKLLADLVKNQDKWDSFWGGVNDKHYKFEWSKFCFCKDPSFRGPFTVEVHNDDLKVTWSETGALAAKYNPDIRPMEGIFSTIGKIIRPPTPEGKTLRDDGQL